MIQITLEIDDLKEDLDPPRQLMLDKLVEHRGEADATQTIQDLLEWELNNDPDGYIESRLKSIVGVGYEDPEALDRALQQSNAQPVAEDVRKNSENVPDAATDGGEEQEPDDKPW